MRTFFKKKERNTHGFVHVFRGRGLRRLGFGFGVRVSKCGRFAALVFGCVWIVVLCSNI